MNDTRTSKKDKNQHIQVFVRVRPISNAEKNGKSTEIVEVPSNKEVLVYERPQDRISKKFTFDRVFGPMSKQIDVYNAVVSPLLEEVLSGYNCTVFAYGQTGTGKTFTMEGVSNDSTLHWQNDSNAGMIPRFLSHLFDELRLLEAQEYTVRVSFLELYNEELFDLLSANDDGSKIRLYEDVTKKGSVIIHGLEEVTVHNKSEVYKILEKGSERRRTAATLMNAQSSRSHTVFSITVHIKENTVAGEELLKTGKLNLVDLAGSENVGRSGAIDRRAREAGSINQSLLTLGRVIIALVERAPHIPYRESKLTRLLQESLGGRTKTSIIATVSPASVNLEETLSTLDYAHRAKNITNKPEINQKLSKKALLKEYTEEIERLRKDLLATRERNGVYLAHENYNEMQMLIEKQGKEIEEKINHIKAIEEALQNKEKIFNELRSEYTKHNNEVYELKHNLNNLASALESTNQRLMVTENDRDEQKHLVEKRIATETALISKVQTLLVVADSATEDSQKLHEKIYRKTQVEQTNELLSQRFKTNVTMRLKNIEKDLAAYAEDLDYFRNSLNREVDKQTDAHIQNTAQVVNCISRDLQTEHMNATNNLKKSIESTFKTYEDNMNIEVENITEMTNRDCQLMENISTELANQIHQICENTVAQNLQKLNDRMQERLEYISSYIKDGINEAYNCRRKECNRLSESVAALKRKSVHLFKSETDIMEKHREFAKMMSQLYDKFNSVNDYEEESHSIITNSINRINDVCGNVSDYVVENWSMSDIYRNFEEVQHKLAEIQHDIEIAVEENTDISNAAVYEAKTLINELQSTLSSSCGKLTEFKSSIQENHLAARERIESNRDDIFSAITAANKTVDDISSRHAELMNEEKEKILHLFKRIKDLLECQNTEYNALNTKILDQLRTMENQVNKFFNEEMQRDVPTGSTPARKQFSYPRQFAITSPHERILQRFREAQKLVEASDEDDDTLLSTDTTLKEIVNSTAFSDLSVTPVAPENNPSPILNMSILSRTDNAECTESTLIENEITKLSNTYGSLDTDLDSITSTSTGVSRVHSESEIYVKGGDKENDTRRSIRLRKTKNLQPSRLKRPRSRQILETRN